MADTGTDRGKWSVVYKRAIEKDGSLLFPERLTKDFLLYARRTMGSYLYANQYQNEVIPEDEKTFKPHWLRYYKAIPDNTFRFAFVDPAIGQKAHSDYTGIVLIEADPEGDWYVRLASRERLTPTQIVDKLFDLNENFPCRAIGIETVAYQEALLYMVSEEMRRRKKIIPVSGIKRSKESKQTRILGLVPRFEWGKILVAQGMTDFEDEYTTFPRGSHDDIMDALASLEEIVSYPEKKSTVLAKPHSPHDPNYEKWYIQNLSKQKERESEYD